MSNTEKRLEEFREEFPNKLAEVINDFDSTIKSDLEAFIAKSIHQALAEERERVESALEDYFLSSYPIPDPKVIGGYLREAFTIKETRG